jgi:small subunit ribosomal protein S20
MCPQISGIYQSARKALCLFGTQKTRISLVSSHLNPENPMLKNIKIISYYSLRFPIFAAQKTELLMANHSATKKDVRQSSKRNERNRYYGKTTRNAIRDIKAIDTKKDATAELPKVESMIDKLAKKGTIHKNKAANLKSKLAKKINALAK